MDIGAADVHLQPAHLLTAIQLLAAIDIVLHGKAADIGHHLFVENLFQLGQFFFNHFVHAWVLQAHGVDEAGGAVGNAGGGVAEAGLFCGALEGEGAQHVDIIQLRELIAIAKGAAGGDYRVIQPDAAEGHAQVCHRISSFRSTGPSLQMRLTPYSVSQEQPMQAPKPQPIRCSKLNWPEVTAQSLMALNMASGPQV